MEEKKKHKVGKEIDTKKRLGGIVGPFSGGFLKCG